jgi:hypothetical protein
MRVTNWYKWTRTKKRFAGVSMIVGILMGLSIENNSLWWGVAGIVLCGASAFTVTTIQDHEW